MPFVVKTRDVDGGTSKRYVKREAAFKRFEEMLGNKVEDAIAEQYYDAAVPPTRETVRRLHGVSMFGTLVSFEEVA